MGFSGIILGMGTANERQRYIVTLSLIGWAHTLNDLCLCKMYKMYPIYMISKMKGIKRCGLAMK